MHPLRDYGFAALTAGGGTRSTSRCLAQSGLWVRRPGPARHAQPAPNSTSVDYKRHRPEHSTLYRLVQQHSASVIAHTEANTGARLPHLTKDEFDAGFEYCILDLRFQRLRCSVCGHDKLPAFSCISLMSFPSHPPPPWRA